MMEMETKDPKSTESAGRPEVESRDPKAGATSTETLSEMEESEKVSEDEATNSNETPSTPSPDGAFDETRGGQGGVDDAGPM
ncbi:MAG TPA: hypothetical protein VF779_02520 [Pyrinomonadaceae bacterium]